MEPTMKKCHGCDRTLAENSENFKKNPGGRGFNTRCRVCQLNETRNPYCFVRNNEEGGERSGLYHHKQQGGNKEVVHHDFSMHALYKCSECGNWRNIVQCYTPLEGPTSTVKLGFDKKCNICKGILDVSMRGIIFSTSSDQPSALIDPDLLGKVEYLVNVCYGWPIDDLRKSLSVPDFPSLMDDPMSTRRGVAKYEYVKAQLLLAGKALPIRVYDIRPQTLQPHENKKNEYTLTINNFACHNCEWTGTTTIRLVVYGYLEKAKKRTKGHKGTIPHMYQCVKEIKYLPPEYIPGREDCELGGISYTCRQCPDHNKRVRCKFLEDIFFNQPGRDGVWKREGSETAVSLTMAPKSHVSKAARHSAAKGVVPGCFTIDEYCSGKRQFRNTSLVEDGIMLISGDGSGNWLVEMPQNCDFKASVARPLTDDEFIALMAGKVLGPMLPEIHLAAAALAAAAAGDLDAPNDVTPNSFELINDDNGADGDEGEKQDVNLEVGENPETLRAKAEAIVAQWTGTNVERIQHVGHFPTNECVRGCPACEARVEREGLDPECLIDITKDHKLYLGSDSDTEDTDEE